jgi:hypothetical protein
MGNIFRKCLFPQSQSETSSLSDALDALYLHQSSSSSEASVDLQPFWDRMDELAQPRESEFYYDAM